MRVTVLLAHRPKGDLVKDRCTVFRPPALALALLGAGILLTGCPGRSGNSSVDSAHSFEDLPQEDESFKDAPGPLDGIRDRELPGVEDPDLPDLVADGPEDSAAPDETTPDIVEPDDVAPEVIEPTGEAWEALKEAFPEVAEDLLASATLADGLDEAETAGVEALLEVLQALTPEELALAMPYLLTAPVPCRDDLDILIDGDTADWPSNAWLETPTLDAGPLGEFTAFAAATDGNTLRLALEFEANPVGVTYLSVEIDTSAGALDDFGVAMRLDVQEETVYFWHITPEGQTEGRNSATIQGVRTDQTIEFAIPFNVLIPSERPAIRLCPYLWSEELSDQVTYGREVRLPVAPTPGALEDLLLLLTAVPEGVDDPAVAVAIAIQDRLWTGHAGEVSVDLIRAESAEYLQYALQLPTWLEENGVGDHFSGLGLAAKMHWAYRTGTGVAFAATAVVPRWTRGAMTDELYEYWTIDRQDLEWYRDLLLSQGFPSASLGPEALAREADAMIWENLVYTTSPEGFESQCELGMWDDEFCAGYEELLYGDGIVLGELNGEELTLWSAGSPDFQQGVFADRGHFVGDCGTQTSIMRAVLRSFGYAAGAGRYDKPASSVGPVHMYPTVYDPDMGDWFIPQSADYLEPWAANEALAWVFLPGRFPYAYPSYMPAEPGIMGANYSPVDADNFADVMALHETFASGGFIESFLTDEPDLQGTGQCTGEPPEPYVPFSAVWDEMAADDGTLLQTVVYLPVGQEGPFPVVLHRSIYGWNQQTVERFVGQGYAFVAQWVRGRGGSAGEICLFGCAKEDGLATVEWLLLQEWCNGSIAAVGTEYAAFTALAAATHPAVDAALVVNETGLDIYRGWPGSNGRALLVHFTSWLAYLATGEWPDTLWLAMLNQVPLSEAAAVAGVDVLPFWQHFLNHFSDPDDSTWRKLHGLHDDLADICAPVLHMRSRDWPYFGAVDNARRLQEDGCGGSAAPHYLALGILDGNGWFWGWPEEPDTYADNLIDDFLAVYLAGAKDADDLPLAAWYDAKTDEWKEIGNPAGTVDWTVHLAVAGEWGGTLSEENPADEAWAAVDNDPEAVTDPCANQFNALWFESPPVEAPVVVFGLIAYQLAVKADTPDADVIVTLHEKDSQGEYHFIATGGTRLSYRESGEPSGAVPAGTPVTASGSLAAAAHEIASGSTVVLGIAPQGCWTHDNPNTAEPVGFETTVKSGTLQIGTGGSLDSLLTVPVLP